MAAAAQREEVVDALKQENDALKQENDALKQEIEALKQEKQEFRIHASYYNTARLQVPHDVWVRMTVLHTLNMFHSDFMGVFFDNFHALVKEEDHEAYVRRMADYIRSMKSQFMFVRIERPPRSKRFVLAYMECERVFSLAPRLEWMCVRLSRVPPTLLTKVEVEENKALRLACVGETDYEWALTSYRNGDGVPPLVAALEADDEYAAEVLLDGEADPNEVDGHGRNALHITAWYGCRLPLFHRILGMIHNVNAVTNGGRTALMRAAEFNHLDMVVSLMNHRGVDVNVQDNYHWATALHKAVYDNRPAIVAQLLRDDSIDTSLKDNCYGTPLKTAIRLEFDECEKILREHGAAEDGAPEPSSSEEDDD